MKGPGHRMKFDVRRIWECPLCQRRQRTAGTIVHLECMCLAKENPPRQTWMKLIEEKSAGKTDPGPAV